MKIIPPSPLYLIMSFINNSSYTQVIHHVCHPHNPEIRLINNVLYLVFLISLTPTWKLCVTSTVTHRDNNLPSLWRVRINLYYIVTTTNQLPSSLGPTKKATLTRIDIKHNHLNAITRSSHINGPSPWTTKHFIAVPVA